MKLSNKLVTTIVTAVCFAAIPAFAADQYPTGTAFVIKHASSIEVQSDNPGLYQINGNAIIFNRPGVANFKIIARYGNNNAMYFKESVEIVPNQGSGNLQLVFNPEKNGFETFNPVRNDSMDAAYLPINLDSSGSRNRVAYYGEAKPLVPMDQLDNRTLLHWNLSDEQYRMCYDAAVRFARPLSGISSRKEILRQLAISIREFTDTQVTYSTKASHFLDAYGFFINRTASCQGETCATGFCLNILGIEYEHVNHNKWKHQWCRVKVEDGTYWICDAYGLYCGPEPAPYKHPRFD